MYIKKGHRSTPIKKLGRSKALPELNCSEKHLPFLKKSALNQTTDLSSE